MRADSGSCAHSTHSDSRHSLGSYSLASLVEDSSSATATPKAAAATPTLTPKSASTTTIVVSAVSAVVHWEGGVSVLRTQKAAVSSNTQSAIAESTGVGIEAESEKNTNACAVVCKIEAGEEAGKVRGEENLKEKGENENVVMPLPYCLYL